MGLLERLKEDILIGDGAAGTLLYSYGIDRCFDQLNLTHPDEVLRIHQAYIEAGADLIQTNTYGANYLKLSRYGLEDEVTKINRAAVRLAKQAVTDETYILGTIGGIHGTGPHFEVTEEITRSFREQLYALLLEGVDGLILETYYDLEELTTVLKIARDESDLPIVANVTMHEPGVLQNGIALADALKQLDDLGADVVGINCRLGPYHMVHALESVPLSKTAYLAAYPNASLPEFEDGKFTYKTEPAYFTDFVRRFRDQGVRLIGGCCGTTPDHIKALANGKKGLQPLREKQVPTQKRIVVKEKNQKQEQSLYEKVQTKHSIIVELDTPKHLDTKPFFKGAQALKDAGIDALTLADNSLATPRICNTTMASLVKREIGLNSLVHITCRDRNLIGLQSHLMGLHTLGIRDILAITGDPTKIGDFPGATSVYDATSFELIKLIKQSNEGISFSGKSLRQKTNFHVAAAFNPNVRNLGKSVERMEKKVSYGADYFLTQPIFSREKIIEVGEATKHLNAPIYIGIMPLVSARNAEFLHNEVPGIKLPDEIRSRMAKTEGNPQQAKQEGLAIAKELIDTALDYFKGFYLITPFIQYELSVELATYIQQKIENIHRKQILHEKKTGRNII
ncbi:bifunctional homocysteine S-methyltransferase/methylenetetrahydrofolate reductase [Lederbergia sp. NSJ-179]|uniref:bifunctional homocysteine S-methyltransferase/methylenetetrahydrofolate reductase n=1 Tax=Lederbergia sp. NSJ-179 TaxID=2931402 RepID=UPI001FCFC8F0|nr:bifunctional homocysteine S-methyltransferase/methylenetetrahydrofolate reductase [Lederbergia sp. NSJ-179]MCJ7841201.1 bifunctional homocysteine S-methyltransferase/methylenetetrahydrofolate reductase [Lederbergia sp. NSJ-179]